MASPPPSSSSARTSLTGDDLIHELLRNMEQGLFPVRSTTLVPCLYTIYLHAEDHAMLRPILPHLIAEAKKALDEDIERRQRADRPLALLKKLGISPQVDMQYRRLADDWSVEFLPDLENRLQRSEIEVHSELAPMPRPEYEGSLTRRITLRRSDGQVSSESAPTRAGFADDATRPATSPAASATAHAVLRYEEQGEPREYAITKDLVVVGRGGKAYWVDLRLTGTPDVSREHCRLRRDPATGQFFLKDVSQFGTTVDGARIPRSVEGSDGQETDRHIEVPLPPAARIGLADALFLDFEVLR